MATETPVFRAFSAELFATAAATDKLVVLDLGTEWCHWCHVMERTTWNDPEVRSVLARHYLAAAADADRRLDLAARYQDYGWPATIVFAPDGRELWKNRGYVPPQRMVEILTQLAQRPADGTDPRVAPPASPDAAVLEGGRGLDPATRTFLQDRVAALLDAEQGGYAFAHKYLDLAGAEWLLLQANGGDQGAATALVRWLDAERALHDPVWGGAYQYSHGGTWTNPHFEKVMARQRADLRAYSLAHAAFGRAPDLDSARTVARYLLDTLRSDHGPFHASQDADVVRGEHAADYFALDDAGRRRIGVPRIERSVWSRENGQALQALASLQAIAPEPLVASALREATDWLLQHRRRSDDLFDHGDDDLGGPFLADSLEMAEALVALGEVLAERRFWEQAHATLRAVDATFSRPQGYVSARGDGLLSPVVDRAENLQLARLAVHLHHLTGDVACSSIADRAFAAAATPSQAREPGLSAEMLLADHAITHEPLHVVVVGDLDDAEAKALHEAALRHAPAWRTIEWILPGTATMRGERYPANSAAAFLCDAAGCSPPIGDPAALRELLETVAGAGR